jgi:nucleotide-binding universal stress UspA family protein
MNTLLIPVDFSATTANMLRYIADFSHDFPIDNIVLLKVFPISLLANLYPSPDFIQLSIDKIADLKRQSEDKFLSLSEDFRTRVSKRTQVETIFVTEELLSAVAFFIEKKAPELIAIGNALEDDETEVTLKEFIVPIAQMSNVPLLLIPDKVNYRNIDRVVLPTSFINLERLLSFKCLAKFQTWLKADIFVLNVDNAHRHDEIEADDEELIKHYLDGFNYQLNYTYGDDIPGEVLLFARQQDAQLILALPGKHNFLYYLIHKSVARSYTLQARFPVLVLK